MSGLVGIIANDAARFSLFTSCTLKLRSPENTQVECLIGGDWCGARNDLVRMALEREADWLWFMDDDHAFPPSLLNRLLAHELPLVMPLCLTRVFPFAPVAYTSHNGVAYEPINPGDHDETLVEIVAGGCAGMLIRREVLQAIPEPWFEYADRSEDIIFCEKAREAGFRLYCDTEARLGHITTAVVWPAEHDGEWVTGFGIGHELNLYAPWALKEPV
jgi:hypothetical protein